MLILNPWHFKKLSRNFQTTYERHLPNIFPTPSRYLSQKSRHLSVILPTPDNSRQLPYSIPQKAVVYNISVIRRVRGARAYNQIKGLSYLGIFAYLPCTLVYFYLSIISNLQSWDCNTCKSKYLHNCIHTSYILFFLHNCIHTSLYTCILACSYNCILV